MSNAIYAGMFDTKIFSLKAKTLHHLQKVLAKEGKGYQNVLHKRCGAGLTEVQFNGLVQMLVGNHFCTCSVGERGAVTITLNTGEQNAE